ncbi:Tn3 family transposase [Streptomyces sp. NBC_01619]|uniref:Tn3 family transposase n=1 Tax=Streptomyces sp. NBC_01619 TaxID=2975901 RepID=UPI00338DA4AD
MTSAQHHGETSHSDMAFGLYKMLGFRFAPRFRDLADQRFWRADLPDGEEPAAGYLKLPDVVDTWDHLGELGIEPVRHRPSPRAWPGTSPERAWPDPSLGRSGSPS